MPTQVDRADFDGASFTRGRDPQLLPRMLSVTTAKVTNATRSVAHCSAASRTLYLVTAVRP
jgi:hypothetical protein